MFFCEENRLPCQLGWGDQPGKDWLEDKINQHLHELEKCISFLFINKRKIKKDQKDLILEVSEKLNELF
jgi:hypothetical protein